MPLQARHSYLNASELLIGAVSAACRLRSCFYNHPLILAPIDVGEQYLQHLMRLTARAAFKSHSSRQWRTNEHQAQTPVPKEIRSPKAKDHPLIEAKTQYAASIVI